MRFTLSASAFLALLSSAFAQTADFDPITAPASDATIAAGAPFTVEWTAPAKYADGTITIQLIGGPSQATQQVIGTIASGVQNSAGKYSWSVDSSLGTEAFYGLIFRLDSDPSVFQYSNPFHIQSGSYGNLPPAQSGSYGDVPAGTTTVTTSTGVKTVTLATQSTQAAVVTSVADAPPPVTDVTVIVNATTTVPCSSSTVDVPAVSSPTTLQSATRLPPPPNSSPVYTAPSQVPVATTTQASASAPSKPAATSQVPLPTNAGARVGGSSLALVASLVVAFFALADDAVNLNFDWKWAMFLALAIPTKLQGAHRNRRLWSMYVHANREFAKGGLAGRLAARKRASGSAQ
ncbi:hypothetical protein Trco_005569 [Trichoderma cornu-damae]|uniref:Yeast cell wall synthesis Kre9/Knh1-like N-terminal domain-containing protein n=1 Tax=Trichoderma cornu-damae TaxID=654480 RepID=A0A9P8QHI3_9HYPO|nr:hypothetical protein Trco_005569 [Trichoderma cornu-damae]